MTWKTFISGLFAPSPTNPPPIKIALAQPDPPIGEAAYSLSSVNRAGGRFIETYNPELIQLHKGSGIYAKMLRDPQVRAAYHLSVELLLSRKWRFIELPSKRQAKVLRFFMSNIERMEGTFKDLMRKMLTSKQTGVSLTEKVYQAVEWEGSQHWMLRTGKLRPLSTFTFEEDAHGNLVRLIQNVGTNRLILEPARFIIHINKPETDPVWGDSDLAAVYTAWWEKNNISKLWDTYLERIAGGFISVKRSGAISPTANSNLQDLLNNAKSAMGVLLPENAEISIQHAPPTDAFERAITQKNLEIARGFLLPQLLGFSEQGRVGSYAQAAVQSEVFFQYLINEGDRVADVLNESLWAELAWWNFGVEEFPRMVFEPITEEHRKQLLETWGLMVEKGAVVPRAVDEARIRKLLGFDEGDESPPLPRTNSGPIDPGGQQ